MSQEVSAGTTTVVVVPGPSLSGATASEFRRRIRSVSEASGKLVLDFSEVRNLDSSGLGAVLDCREQIGKKGGTLRICGLDDRLRLLFEMTRLHRTVEIYRSREEALRSFRVPRLLQFPRISERYA